jgi:hypothetical protein
MALYQGSCLESSKGRGKEQRWTDASPSSGGSSSTRSFRDVLLGGESRPPPPPSAASTVDRALVRLLLKKRLGQPSPSNKPDSQGWQRVQSRREHKSSRRHLRGPRCLVSVDLRGKCFNCFSSAYCAAECRSPPRCFRCQEIGHYSYKCVSLSLELALPSCRSTRV